MLSRPKLIMARPNNTAVPTRRTDPVNAAMAWIGVVRARMANVLCCGGRAAGMWPAKQAGPAVTLTASDGCQRMSLAPFDSAFRSKIDQTGQFGTDRRLLGRYCPILA
jgi:hypothetical protein